jgi:exopolysaccharide production protein ExoY
MAIGPVASLMQNSSPSYKSAALSSRPEAKALLAPRPEGSDLDELSWEGDTYLKQYLPRVTSGDIAALQWPAWVVAAQHPSLRSWSYRVGKRIFDVTFAITLLPFLAPICLLLMLLVKCSSKGPVFYKHLRVGQDGRDFYLYKFRTMFLHDEALLADYLATNTAARREWDEHYKLRWDPRVTRLGAVLRRTSLDELPQVVNVLLGHMSFVGPRPIVQDEIRRYGSAFTIYASAKPGITGLWQVSGRGAVSYATRVSLDITYVITWSFLRDLWVLLKTARSVFSLLGAY